MWYRRGGGPAGNVAAHTLTVLKDPLPGLEVTNPERATGGQAAETIENAIIRGPQEFFALRRAVTARDFELVAERWGAVARAKAITKARLWVHALPGTVEVLLVPEIPEEQRAGGRASLATLLERQTDAAREQIQRALDEQRPLGTKCLVSWARYKSVRVRARVVAHPAEDTEALKGRILARLHATINPLPSESGEAGRMALRRSAARVSRLRHAGARSRRAIRRASVDARRRCARESTSASSPPTASSRGRGMRQAAPRCSVR